MDERRLEAAKSRLTPRLREAIHGAATAGKLPPTLLSAISMASLNSLAGDRAPLESLVSIAALEAIVQRFGRPPLVVRNHQVVLEPLPDFPPETDALIKGAEFRVASVGRVEFVNHSMSWAGTGWIAKHSDGKAIVITNRHVAELVARRVPGGGGVFMRSPAGPRYRVNIDFNEEVDSARDDSATVPVTGIEYLADDLAADVALLMVEAAGLRDRAPIELSERRLKKDDLVALIGYPAYDSRNDASDQARYFRDLYEVKRFAPGRIMQPPSEGGMLTHDCTSLGGNSGSPLISLEDEGKVVGLHFSGEYGKFNAAVTAATLAALLVGARPLSDLIPNTQKNSERADGHHPPETFEGRRGFDTQFLAAADGSRLKTPWPGLPPELGDGLAKPEPAPIEPNELRYMHFGVKYSAALRLPLLTAVNIDGLRSERIKREGDRWFTDGRIAQEIQLGGANYADSQIDRGHMVRREDPNWNPVGGPHEAPQADLDTFHYVNAAPQHSLLNQGKTLWQGLENYILDSARTHGFQACVFTGPVAPDPADDPPPETIDGALVPLEFWKLVVTLDEGGENLHATAYLLSQGQLIRDLMEKRSRREGLEGFALGAYRTFQIAVGDLATATGYDLSAYIGADPLAKLAAATGQEAVEAGEPVVLSLETFSDIRL